MEVVLCGNLTSWKSIRSEFLGRYHFFDVERIADLKEMAIKRFGNDVEFKIILIKERDDGS